MGSIATGDDSTALGVGSTATEFNLTALGQFSQATGTNSTAVGAGSQATGFASTALGLGSNAAFSFSTAIGADATTTRDGQIVLGTAATTYTAPGITSAASTAAQSGPVQIVTTDADGNLAADTPAGLGLATAGSTAALQEGIRRNSEGVAMAMALSGIPATLPRGKNYAVSTAWGGFNGESALSVGGAAALSDNVYFSGGAAFSTGRNVSGGGRAGVTIAW